MARIGLAVAALGIAAVLTACSSDDGDGGDSGDSASGSDFVDSSPEDIVAAAKSAMGELTAVKVDGTINNEGEEIVLDLQTSASGDCAGTIGVGDGVAELRGVGGATWMKPNDAFWETFAGPDASTVLALVGDKWVVIPEDEDSFNEFCDVDELLDEMLKDDEEDDESTYSVGDTEDLNGQEVVPVDNEDPEDGTSTGYVLVDDPHYLVKIEKTEGESTGVVEFSAFDEEFEVEAPADDEVVDLDNLAG